MRPMARSPRNGVFSTFGKHCWRPARPMWNFGSSELTISPSEKRHLLDRMWRIRSQLTAGMAQMTASTARLRTRWSLSAVFVGFDWVWAKAQALHP